MILFGLPTACGAATPISWHDARRARDLAACLDELNRTGSVAGAFVGDFAAARAAWGFAIESHDNGDAAVYLALGIACDDLAAAAAAVAAEPGFPPIGTAVAIGDGVARDPAAVTATAVVVGVAPHAPFVRSLSRASSSPHVAALRRMTSH